MFTKKNSATVKEGEDDLNIEIQNYDRIDQTNNQNNKQPFIQLFQNLNQHIASKFRINPKKKNTVINIDYTDESQTKSREASQVMAPLEFIDPSDELASDYDDMSENECTEKNTALNSITHLESEGDNHVRDSISKNRPILRVTLIKQKLGRNLIDEKDQDQDQSMEDDDYNVPSDTDAQDQSPTATSIKVLSLQLGVNRGKIQSQTQSSVEPSVIETIANVSIVSIMKSDQSNGMLSNGISSGVKASKNSNEQFDMYTSEIYNKLDNFASNIDDYSNEDQLFRSNLPVILTNRTKKSDLPQAAADIITSNAMLSLTNLDIIPEFQSNQDQSEMEKEEEFEDKDRLKAKKENFSHFKNYFSKIFHKSNNAVAPAPLSDLSEQHGFSQEEISSLMTAAPSKLLKIIGIGEAEVQRDLLSQFGELNYLQNHPCEKDDLIVKYYNKSNAIEAYESLKVDYQVVYVPTKHDSDEANNFRYDKSNELYGGDTSITLNMLRISNNSISPKNVMKTSVPIGDQFFRMESSGIFQAAQEVQNEANIQQHYQTVGGFNMQNKLGNSLQDNPFQMAVHGEESFIQAEQIVPRQKNAQDFQKFNSDPALFQNEQFRGLNQQFTGNQAYYQNPAINRHSGGQMNPLQTVGSADAVSSRYYNYQNNFNHNNSSGNQTNFSQETVPSFGKQQFMPNREPKMDFKINLDMIIKQQDPRTTIMIKNIPNKYTQAMLLETFDRQQSNQYDFFYLPIDIKNQCNMGYAFINFIHPVYIVEFFWRLDSKKWECFNSDKICKIAYGRMQGKQELELNFSNMNVASTSNNSAESRQAKVRPLILDPQIPSFEQIETICTELSLKQIQIQNEDKSDNQEISEMKPKSNSKKYQRNGPNYYDRKSDPRSNKHYQVKGRQSNFSGNSNGHSSVGSSHGQSQRYYNQGQDLQQRNFYPTDQAVSQNYEYPENSKYDSSGSKQERPRFNQKDQFSKKNKFYQNSLQSNSKSMKKQ